MSVPYLRDDCCSTKAAQCGKALQNLSQKLSTWQRITDRKAHGLKASLDKQRTFFTKPMKKSQNATEASFRAAHFLIKNKKTFSDGKVCKETMMLVANTLFKDKKHGPEVISALSDVQLGASTMARRVSSLSENLTEQVDRDLAACRWFSIQCDESVDSASTAQLMIFI